MKNHLINKLILLEVSLYRKAAYHDQGKYKKEPVGFKLDLHSIYETLTEEQLEILINLKQVK